MINHVKTFSAIEKLKDVEIELHRLKNALEMSSKDREWVGLTDEERNNIINQAYDDSLARKGIDTDLEIAKNIEAKLKEINTWVTFTKVDIRTL